MSFNNKKKRWKNCLLWRHCQTKRADPDATPGGRRRTLLSPAAQSRRSDWRYAICPSTRLCSALGQEILLHSRLHMKYRAGMVAPEHSYIHLDICVIERFFFPSGSGSGELFLCCCLPVIVFILSLSVLSEYLPPDSTPAPPLISLVSP